MKLFPIAEKKVLFCFRRVLLVAIFLVWTNQTFADDVSFQSSFTNSLDGGKLAKIEKAIQAEMKRQKDVVGLAIGIISDGHIVYEKGFGFADLEKHLPVTRQTMFRWASCSKPLTAVAAMHLVEKKQLDLNSDVRKYVPEFPDKKATITSRDLLCHQGGISHYSPVVNLLNPRQKYDIPHPFENVVLALDVFKKAPLVCQPREKFSYSTYGYILLSAVVERAGHEKFASQIRNRIAQPLGMTTLQPDYQWVNIPNRAVGYRKDNEKTVPSADTDVSYKLGGGGFISNIDDFARFAAGLINRKLVTESSETAMWTQQKLGNGSPTTYGFGFRCEKTANGRLCVEHNGSQEKAKCCFMIYPGEKHGVVVMSNSEWVNPDAFCVLIDKIACTN